MKIAQSDTRKFDKNGLKTKEKVLVSVIIPTYNSVRHIERCLKSINAQTYPYKETIVVDNYSTDASREIAERYARVYIEGPERCSQRNFAVTKANGDFFLFIDSDMELTLDVVSECVGEALNGNVDAIVIPEISTGEGFWSRVKTLEKSCYIKDSSIEAPRFFRKEAFLNVNGYDESLIAAEDWDLSLRIKKRGFSFSRVNAFIKHHEGRLTLRDAIRKKYRYGLSIRRYIKKHKEESRRQLMVIRPAFLRNYKLLLRQPITTMGLVIMKLCEFGAGLCGIIVNKFHMK